jgi:PAS domain S-box-containing protein
MVRQRYRTLSYRLLRHPLGAGAFLSLLYIPLYLLTTAFAIPDATLVVRVDFGLTHLGFATLAASAELLIGGLIAELLWQAFPAYWGRSDPLQPAPIEKSLQLRFFYGIGPFVLLLLATLMVGDWVVAGNAARNMLRDRLSGTARVASESVPFFLEAGQNLLLQMSEDPRLLSSPPQQIPEVLHKELISIPFFRQLYLLDYQGHPVAGYPEVEFVRLFPTPEEQIGIQLALKGISVQTYTVPPVKGESAAQVAFIAAVKDSAGRVQGVLLGRSDLASNPYTKPVVQAFEKMNEQGEVGVVLDENGKILYHPLTSLVMTQYTGQVRAETSFFEEAGPNGIPNLVFFQPTLGRSWSIVLSVPAQRAQQMALDIALPLIVMILAMAVLAFVALRLGLRVVTASLHTLAGEAGRIAQGQLDGPLPASGDDEVGQLRGAFDRMRTSLKARLDELNKLLLVSQGVASSLEMEDAVRPILESALGDKASAARVVLVPQEDPDPALDIPTSIGMGPENDTYTYLDDQLLTLTKTHNRLVLSNLTRGRGLTFTAGLPRPGSVLAFALRHEMQYYGTLWVAYPTPRTFTEEEVRFLTTLAGQAALAASNARLYASAEIGRQRLEAILASTPDPVLVTDRQNHIMLSNPASLQLPGLASGSIQGKSMESVISQRDLLDLLRAPDDEQPSREIYFPNGRVYYATVSPVKAGGQLVGKVCLLRNITHFKEVDTLKSDFVATVSHDLRSPLTLMRGYATMLQMVGELNDQQKSYVRKIIGGVESMSRLVNSLLDLGRIEAGVGLQLEMVTVLDTIERVASSMQLQATQKNIKLNQVIPGGCNPVIEADQALIQQALYNLVENGIKYTPVGGSVSIRVMESPEAVVLEVSDTGIGIAPLDQPRLFEKFYRVGQREADAQRGSGLGLAIVKSIAERHGGRIWLESSLGKGSTFYLEIPFHQDKQPLTA